jgi:hypothetical protein
MSEGGVLAGVRWSAGAPVGDTAGRSGHLSRCPVEDPARLR